ncbi:UDP-N-acetylmuramoyl-L-alanyl-D-glutamate--2,6-diaminopimelate ligase [Pseudomarimonas arenosa]|nr:UDP-N-acetylmuramoyl-L-alanyl-D-glutamate--2,6-diaminopimelate ligase [Pseudomarimonas arenosa]
MNLRELLPQTVLPADLAQRPVGDLHLDSRALQPGDVFVALAGRSTHGLSHLSMARQNGAIACLYEPPLPASIEDAADLLPIADLRADLGRIARRRYADVSRRLRLIGVTGTNGKTSTVQLLAQALDFDSAAHCGHIGTLGVGMGEWHREGERTTPDVLSVHRLLDELAQRGADHVAMEVSSHALDQGRVDGLQFAVAVFTNLTRDHLDYHGSMDAYGDAKARLFLEGRSLAAVINVDDPFGANLARRVASQLPLLRLSSSDSRADLFADRIDLNVEGLSFQLHCDGERHAVSSGLLGRFNVDNLLAVAGALRALGMSAENIARRLSALRPVPGRMERVSTTQPLVVVDYAHTPDALEQTLRSLRAHTEGQLICVFGCGGDRDRGKRPLMAAVAEQLADRLWVTDDNPRSESGDHIVAEIMHGFRLPQRVSVQRRRELAIAEAIGAAAANDTVLIAGKGHETYQDEQGQRRPFDDRVVARRALAERAA